MIPELLAYPLSYASACAFLFVGVSAVVDYCEERHPAAYAMAERRGLLAMASNAVRKETPLMVPVFVIFVSLLHLTETT